MKSRTIKKLWKFWRTPGESLKSWVRSGENMPSEVYTEARAWLARKAAL